ncbi:NACHT domain-containing protein [Streptomyces sp. NPDC058621]
MGEAWRDLLTGLEPGDWQGFQEALNGFRRSAPGTSYENLHRRGQEILNDETWPVPGQELSPSKNTWVNLLKSPERYSWPLIELLVLIVAKQLGAPREELVLEWAAVYERCGGLPGRFTTTATAPASVPNSASETTFRDLDRPAGAAGSARAPAPALLRAAAQLARAVHRERETDREARRTEDPFALQVRWHVWEELQDHWSNIHRLPAGAETEAGPLDLAGRYDRIADTFEQVPSARLVVLGQRGSGKSVLAGRFVQDRLSRRTDGERVPVVFDLKRWNAVGDLRDWLAGALAEHYRGLDAPAPDGVGTLAGALVDAELILPVLDGFDEIGAVAHTELLRQIHGRGRLPFVLTSLPEPYMTAVRTAGPVSGAAVITLEDLTTDDLAGYLPRTPGLAGHRWSAVLERVRQAPDAPDCAALRVALATPLITGLARTVYSGDRDPHVLLDVRRFGSAAVLEQHLLDQYVDDVYRTGAPGPGGTTGPRKALRQHRAELAVHWLGFLAHSGQDFGWWQTADLVPRRQRVLVFVLLSLLVGSVAGLLLMEPVPAVAAAAGLALMAGLAGSSRAPRPVRVVPRLAGRGRQALWEVGSALAGGLAVGGAGWLAVQQFGWWALAPVAAVGNAFGSALSSWGRGEGGRDRRIAIGTGFGGGAAGGGAIALIGTLMDWPFGPWVHWLTLGLTIGAMVGVGSGMKAHPAIDTVVAPRQLLVDNRSYALLQTCTVGCGYMVTAGVLGGLKAMLVTGPVIGLAFGVAAHAWGRWVILGRLWLPLRGRLPWRLWEFLADAHSRELLVQSGAFYRFRHERLRQTLAARYTERLCHDGKSQVECQETSRPERSSSLGRPGLR